MDVRYELDQLVKEHPGASRTAAVDAALIRVRWLQAEEDLTRIREAREFGRGRRPRASEVRTAQKRAGLERRDYLVALTRLTASSKASKGTSQIADLVREGQ